MGDQYKSKPAQILLSFHADATVTRQVFPIRKPLTLANVVRFADHHGPFVVPIGVPVDPFLVVAEPGNYDHNHVRVADRTPEADAVRALNLVSTFVRDGPYPWDLEGLRADIDLHRKPEAHPLLIDLEPGGLMAPVRERRPL
jgi:hypothetical protein